MPELKPTSYPDWATDDVTLPVAGTDNKIEPRAIMKTQGADRGNFFGAEEANWILNSNGKWTRYLGQEVQKLLDTNLREYNTVADMVADPLLEVNDYVRTLGYHSFGDTGGSIYKVVSSGTADGMTIIALDNGLRAEFVYTSNVFSPMQFGAIGNGTTNDSVPMQKVLDLGEDNPSNATLSNGIIIDLNNKTYAVDVTFQSKTTIKNGTLAQTISDANILNHVEGGTKSDGWDYLHLDGVTLDGRGLGSGDVTRKDNFNGYILEETNNGLLIKVLTTSANGYNLSLEGCTFKNLWNTNITLINEVTTDSSARMSVTSCNFNPHTTTDEGVYSFLIDLPNINTVNTPTSFIFDKCTFEFANTLLYSSKANVHFKACSLELTNAADGYLLTGDGDVSFTDCPMIDLDTGDVAGGGAWRLSYSSYKVTFKSSTLRHTFDNLLVHSLASYDTYLEYKAKDTTFIGNISIDRDPGVGSRLSTKVSSNGCEYIDNVYSGGLQINPDFPYNSLTTSNGVESVSGRDEVKLVGNTCHSKFYANMTESNTDFICTGNNIYYDNRITHSGSIFYFRDPDQTYATITGNSFKNNSVSLLTALIGAEYDNIDVDHYIGIAGNHMQGFGGSSKGANYTMISTTDATTLPLMYNS